MPKRAVGTGLVVIVALLIVVIGVVMWANGDSRKIDERANLIDMQQGADAMQRAGQAMQTHGQTMLDEGQRTGDQELTTHGQHWTADGQALIQGGEWMAMNPTVPSNLVSNPGDLGAQDSWGELNRSAQQMLQDPSDAKDVDLEALNWNGEAMQAEGRNMADHGRLMAEETEMMVERHNLEAQAATDLRAAAQTMVDIGSTLEQNGKEMRDYSSRVRRSLGE